MRLELDPFFHVTMKLYSTTWHIFSVYAMLCRKDLLVQYGWYPVLTQKDLSGFSGFYYSEINTDILEIQMLVHMKK